MKKTDTTYQINLTPIPPLKGGLNTTDQILPSSEGQKPHYIDYSLISGLAPRRMKRDFVSWVDMEFTETVIDTPENRVYYIGKKVEKMEGVEKVEKASVISSEAIAESRYPTHDIETLGYGFVPTQEGQRQSGCQSTDFILTLESALIGVLARMESRGVAFDKEKLMDIGERIRSDIAKLETEIYDLIGERFNLNSPKQLQVILFEKLGIKPKKKNKTGYSVDNDVLEDIAQEYDIARLILEYRGLAKLSSTYVEGLLRSVQSDNKIHTTYDSLGAATGRMSSIDPNLQNIPSGDGYAREIKECFIATQSIQNSKFKIHNTGARCGEDGSKEMGYLESGILNLESENILIVADYSQIELRILAFLSQDASLLDAFAHGEDIHARTAFFLFGEKVGGDKKTWKATSEQRRIAKSVNFGVIYGITGFGLAKTLGCSSWEAQEYVNAFYIKYPGVRTYYDTLLVDARVNGYVETYFGRRRYIPSLNDANKTLRAIAEREAMNMPVQGTAADIIKIAMVELDKKIAAMGLTGCMILQVHDELVFDIPVSEKEVFEKLVSETMEGVLESSKFTCTSLRDEIQNIKSITGVSEVSNKLESIIPPIIVDISTGTNWAQAK